MSTGYNNLKITPLHTTGPSCSCQVTPPPLPERRLADPPSTTSEVLTLHSPMALSTLLPLLHPDIARSRVGPRRSSPRTPEGLIPDENR
jgi:hypothetical protein